MAQDGTIQIEVLMDTDEFQNELKKLGATAEAGFQTISAATEKMTGFNSGSRICSRILNGPQPSIMADSSNSRGSPRTN